MLNLLDTNPRGAIAPTAAPQGLATASQAAAYLAVSRTTLWRLGRQGVLHPVRLGRTVRYRWADLRRTAGLEGGAA
ncbi:MAG: helix-turn-helix domain-containing protein [Thiomonas sp.]